MTKLILIVDPFSSGKLYAKLFHQLGYRCYAVLSNPNLPEFFRNSYDPSYFENQTLLSIQEAKQTFSAEQIQAVVIGAETAVFAGEMLAEYFQVKGNSAQNSIMRRDKFAMQQQLKKAGLRYIQSQQITQANHDVSEILSHAAYVLKPLNSAGTENVTFCANKTELQQHIAQIKWGEQNITGEINQTFLVQEFIQGEEFVVDMLAENGTIHILSLCKYRKGEYNQSRFVYEHMEMLDPQASQYRYLIDYATQCATALGFEFGPIHMEIMASGSEVVMIEAGARLHGGVAPQIFQACYQPDLLTQAVNLYAGNAHHRPTQQTRFARVVFLINQQPNALFDQALFQHNIKQLPSFLDVVFTHYSPLPLTVDLLSCPCFVSLVATDYAQLEHDEQQLRKLFLQCLE